MDILLRIPDDVASRVAETGADMERQALEAWVADNYRRGLLGRADLRAMLGLETVDEIDGFLKGRGIVDYDVEDLLRDRATLDALGS